MSVASSTSPVRNGAAPPQGLSRSFALRAAAVLAISVAAAAGGSAALSGSTPHAAPHRIVALPEVGAVSAAQAASFEVLRRPLVARDAFAAIHAGSGPLGANPSLARTVPEPRGGLSAGTVSVVPANGAVCLRVPYRVGGAQWFCQPLGVARAGKLIMALRPAGPLRASRQLLVGLVPDGVHAVRVTTAAGSSLTVPVRSNVYDVQLVSPRTVTIDLPGSGARRYLAP